MYVAIAGRPRALHRVVMESVLGRWLEPHEDVHHLDHNRRNNHPSNLRVLDHAEHARKHRGRDPLFSLCERCGRRFLRRAYWTGPKDPRGRAKHLVRFCTHRCATLATAALRSGGVGH